ncbi:lanthionine biosynthesis protein LanB [Pseudomonas syringae pv. theae ICMP 3923]|uniref:Lanthionine biosynthesis protein LanB n=1 Tax=Pseudomonas syringae pv. theae TaxID=103985 RepID=A0A0Q0G1P8_PSESX|nr:lantibiotic dehydratase [Pseudomonas syringae]EPM73065.1 lanthionine biosynthesis protein LanB [Pseudomonas syringae pv. theae ICMP 3923]KPZ30525.1 hypothetical protein AN901_202891 [Pseudomonas syringae pv. theae]MBL3873267.1 lantibiotic dehydratase [Pseudomonas syringae pv. theae]RMT58588.1 Lanthionine biosynthesis protein LanB [Pseudomonas syringae pv. theae]GKQ30538.1 lantibiotic dehydratase [Pseudomonas syringae pv. theae]
MPYKLNALDFFVLRTPLFPLSSAVELGHALRKIPIDYITIRANQILMEALWLGNRRLYQYIVEGTVDKYAAAHAIERYILRMCYRSTPFGIFAGISVGDIESESSLILEPPHLSRRHVTIDVDYIGEAEKLVADSDPNPQSRYSWNSTYLMDLGYSHYLTEQIVESTKVYKLNVLHGENKYYSLWASAEAGISFSEFTKLAKVKFPKMANHDIVEDWHCLVRKKLIEPCARYHTTGESRFERFSQALNAIDSLKDVAEVYRTLITDIKRINTDIRYDAVNDYASIEERLAAHSALRHENAVHVSLVKSSRKMVLSKAYIDSLLEGLAALITSKSDQLPALSAFAARFQEKYGAEEVPLIIATDPNLGIGYGDSVRIPDKLFDANYFRNTETYSEPFVVDSINRKAIRLINENSAQGNFHSIDLKISELADSGGTEHSRNSVVGLVGQFVEVREGQQWLFHPLKIVPNSAITWLGRFGESSPKLLKNLHRVAALEQDIAKDSILADIIYVPIDRSRNITGRPSLRNYEINCVIGSGIDSEFQIHLNDLMVSVVNGQVILRSVRLGKRVIPRPTCAHSTALPHNPAIYQFLGAVSKQCTDVGFPDFTPALKVLGHLPRMTAGRLILSPEKWFFDSSTIRHLLSINERNGVIEMIRHIMTVFKLPRCITMTLEAGPLELNLSDIIHQSIFVKELKQISDIEIMESMSQSSGSPVIDVQGCHYAHEVFLPMLLRTDTTANGPYEVPNKLPRILRSKLNAWADLFPGNPVSVNAEFQPAFQPTSNWLYLKIPCSVTLANKLLTSYLFPAIDQAQLEGYVSEWFFIRYDEDCPHLRIRLKGDTEFLLNSWIPELINNRPPFLSRQLIFSLETYVPEYYRYGGVAGVRFAQTLFFLDSQMIAKFLNYHSFAESNIEGIDFILASLDRLLSSLALTLDQKYFLMNRQCTKYFLEFQVKGNDKAFLDRNFRNIYNDSSVLYSIAEGATPTLPTHLDELILVRDAGITELLRWEKNSLTLLTAVRLQAYVHMSCNRFFSTDRRLREMLVCDLLRRSYEKNLIRFDNSKLSTTEK